MKQEKIALPVGVTLDRFIKKGQEHYPKASGALSQLLRDIALAAKVINYEISRSGLLNVEGAIGSTNVQGEAQQKLDVIANVRFKRALRHGGEVCAIISEEEDDIIELGNKDSKYVVAMDPLDGSSNIDVNVSIGTVFSIYRRVSKEGTQAVAEDFLQKGSEQVAAGYILYGSSLMIVFTTGQGVNGFTYEPSYGDFFLSHKNMKFPDKGTIYSVNDSYLNQFHPGIRQFINECRDMGLTSRYIGSLVADFHRNLFKGGVYLYPSTTKAESGKLRLVYECNALAWMAEQGGGLATDGKRRILDIQPESFHQRTPFFTGTKDLVNKLTLSLKNDHKLSSIKQQNEKTHM